VTDGGSDPSEVDGETLALAREETRTTFEYQFARIQEIDTKAVEILKANLLLIGIVVTGATVLVQTPFDAASLFNVFTAVGAALLFVSTALAGVTYTASNLRGGLDADAIERSIAADADAFETQLLRSYGRWIEYNAQVIAVNDILVTATVLLIVVSFAYVVAGVAVGAAGLSALGVAAAFVAFTLPTAWLVRLAYHMDHLGTPREESDVGTFAGIRLSKGATRAEGMAALKRMLSGGAAEPPDEDGEE